MNLHMAYDAMHKQALRNVNLKTECYKNNRNAFLLLKDYLRNPCPKQKPYFKGIRASFAEDECNWNEA